MKKSNNIISDWLDKYGDPEIDKKVEMELEKITKGIYYKFIDEAYKNYGDSHTTFLNGFAMVKPMAHSKETFINECKSNKKFAKKWGLKITERLLEHIERKKLMDEYTDSRNMFRIGYQVTNGGFNIERYNKVCDSYDIPTKLLTIMYNNQTIEIYE
jgi:hypothetical protein